MKKSKKSFVTYTLKGDKAFLGTNQIIGTTEGNQRRICENCSNRCLAHPSMSDCLNNKAKKAFGAGEGIIMPKKLEGQHVGNFCQFFEANETFTGKPNFSEDVNTSENQTKPAYVFTKHEDDSMLFVAPAKGKYYYPFDYALPVNTNKNNLRKFSSIEEAIKAGYVSRF